MAVERGVLTSSPYADIQCEGLGGRRRNRNGGTAWRGRCSHPKACRGRLKQGLHSHNTEQMSHREAAGPCFSKPSSHCK